MKKNITKKDIDLLNIQIFISVFLLVTVIISIIVTYDEEQNDLEKKPIFSQKTDKYLNMFNRILSVIIFLVLLYINYEGTELAKQKGSDLRPFQKQLVATLLGLVAALIILSIAIENWNQNDEEAEFENPF